MSCLYACDMEVPTLPDDVLLAVHLLLLLVDTRIIKNIKSLKELRKIKKIFDYKNIRINLTNYF